MNTSLQQAPRPNENGQFQSADRRQKTDNSITQCDDRRKQTDRRHLIGRRASDRQHPNLSFQNERIKNAPAEMQADNKSQLNEIAAKSRSAAQVLSEDEIRFLLDGHRVGNSDDQDTQPS